MEMDRFGPREAWGNSRPHPITMVDAQIKVEDDDTMAIPIDESQMSWGEKFADLPAPNQSQATFRLAPSLPPILVTLLLYSALP